MASNRRVLRDTGRQAATACWRLLLIAAATAIAACSSGGDDDSGGTSPPPPPPTNQAPVADAGGDLNVTELSAVDLLGSAADPDNANNELTFAWTQTGGTTVTLDTPNAASASFTAPDVAAGNPETLTFRLTVTDPGGLSSNDSVSVRVQEPAAVVTISGGLEYEFAAPSSAPAPFTCDGLVFGPDQVRPIRRATVQLLDATGETVLDTNVADDQGRYTLTANASTDVMIRVRAELLQSGAASWNVQVRNNVVDPNAETVDPSAPPLDQRPLYVMDSAVFNSGATDISRPTMVATTGWGGSSYTGPRVAAPFAILDAIYQAMLLILAEDPSADFPALDAYWSPDNGTSPRTGSFQDAFANGDLGVSFYFRGPTGDGSIVGPSLFLLGRDGDDTEEFDSHVIVHEWGHYFEDNFSRSDSIGGSHGAGDILDKRVSFGEGWATALSAIALDDPSYCDTLWFAGELRGFEINAENEPANSEEGWYNETTVIKFLYDLWDTNSDIAADTGSIGFTPIFNVLTGPQVFTEAFTSVFSFAAALKTVSGEDAFVNGLLTAYGIESNVDIWGSTETNDTSSAAAVDDVFPLYTDVTLGATTRICVNNQFDTSRDGNKLTQRRYLRFDLGSSQPLSFTMTTVDPPTTPVTTNFDCNDPDFSQHSDPNFRVWRSGGFFVNGDSCEANSQTESPVGNFPTGIYVIDLYEGRYADSDTANSFPDRLCYDFTIN
jgi:hypothetical protein